MGNSSAKTTSGSTKLLSTWVEFSIKEKRIVYSFIKSPVPCAEEVFDAICVLVTPTEDLRAQAAIVGEKLLHSFVLLLNSKSGQGLKVEYLADNFGKVNVIHGCLAKSEDNDGSTCSGEVSCLNAMPLGFYRCNITLENLLAFNSLFENLCEFDITDHNCHIYHRSLLATVLRGKFLYNIKDPTSSRVMKAATTSQFFHGIGGDFVTKESILDSLKRNASEMKYRSIHSFHIRDLLNEYSGPIQVKAVNFNPNIHRRLPLGNVSYSDSSNLYLAFQNCEKAIKEGNTDNLVLAVKECKQYKLVALAELGSVLITVLKELAKAQSLQQKDVMTKLLAAVHELKHRFSALNINSDLQEFVEVKSGMQFIAEWKEQQTITSKSFQWSLMNGNTEILRASTARLVELGLQEKHDQGIQVISLIDKLTAALESNSIHGMVEACDEAEINNPSIGNFWVYKKCKAVLKENENTVLLTVLRRRRILSFIAIVVIIMGTVIQYWG